MDEHVETFACMGSTVRISIGEPARAGMRAPEAAAVAVRLWLKAYEHHLSRFRADSELSRLNHDRRRVVPASPLLRSLVSAGLWAAKRSAGLVDPTLLEPLVLAGYEDSLADATPIPLAYALELAPKRAVAAPNPAAGWSEFHVDNDEGVITRPPGVGFDPGGIGKGLAADALAPQLEGYTRFTIDCAGDMRLGGTAFGWGDYFVKVRHPLTGGTAHLLQVTSGAVATSSIASRLWRRPDGTLAHHLLDPSTGEPAWTGLISATALAPTTLEAETLAKMALLSGPRRARKLLAAQGGLTIHENGDVELHGEPARPHTRHREPSVA